MFFGSPGLSTSDVADLGSFSADPNQRDGVTTLESGAATDPDGRPLRAATGHSDYLAPGTTSQHNVAATLAGHPDLRVIGDSTGLGDYLTDPVGAAR